MRSRRAKSPEIAADPLGDETARAFDERYPGAQLADVVVVIAAFNEEEAIGGVLTDIAAESCGLRVDTLVVDDGSADRTGEVVLEHNAYLARLPVNSGQGTAFRVGYRIARERGARYIITLDADGQWDPADIPAVLQPVVDGEADLVLGSRVLGSSEATDNVRRAGVRVFSALVRAISGVNVTDTSSGLRAMVADLTANVRQEQPQYQASELLLGAIFQGYRVAERPIVEHKRAAGESKKGHNALYGLRYAQVILRTWLRERRAGPAARRGSTREAERARG